MCGSAARRAFALWQQVDPKPATTSTAPLTLPADPLLVPPGAPVALVLSPALAALVPPAAPAAATWPSSLSPLTTTPLVPEAKRTVPVKASLPVAAVLGALLLVPAGLVEGGTWLWPRGLAFLAACGAIGLAGNLALATWRPEHFEVRRQGVVASREKRQPRIDAVGAVLLSPFAAAASVRLNLSN